MPPKPSARLSVGCVTNSWAAFDQCLKQRLYSLLFDQYLKNRVAEEKWGSVSEGSETSTPAQLLPGMNQTAGFEAAQGAQQTLREWRQAMALVWSGNLRQWCEGMTVFIACRPALDAVAT